MQDSTGIALIADIGGTNTRVALAHGARVAPGSVRRYRNAEFPGLEPVLHSFLAESGHGAQAISGVCVAAAGPVRDGVARLTNLNWEVDRSALARTLTAQKAAVLNDLQAQGHAIGHIAPKDLTEVLPQPAHSAKAAKLVIGIGTGFNASPVFDTAAGRFVPPSEAGMVSLPVSEPAILPHLAAFDDGAGHATVEEILSGRGLCKLHAALHGLSQSPAEIMAAIEAGEARACDTGRVFVRVMGAVVGDLALGHLPFGGIYLIGGVTRAFLPYLQAFGFADAFRAKGRFAPFMAQFGVTVVTDDYAALTGCASHLAKL